MLECKLAHTLELGRHTQFVGEIVDVKIDESVLNEDGTPDIEKVMPIIYATQTRRYYKLGQYLGPAYTIGKGIRK